MNLFEKKANDAIVSVHTKKQKVMDLNGEYHYSELISGDEPLQLQMQNQLLDRLQFAKTLGYDGIGKFETYGDFTATLKRFDTFNQNAERLKEIASEIIEIENITKETNAFIQKNLPFLPTEEQQLIPEHKALYEVAKEYLIKSPMIHTFERANLRTNIIREALMDLSEKQIDMATDRKMIEKEDVMDISHVIDLSGERAKHFESNLDYVLKKFGVTKETNKEYKELHTNVRGTSFKNDDTGIERQEILGRLNDWVKAEKPVYFKLNKTVVHDKPAYEVLWGHDNSIERLGYLADYLAQQMDKIYGDAEIPIVFDQVTGGGVGRNGKSYSFGCNFTLQLPDLAKAERIVPSERKTPAPESTPAQEQANSLENARNQLLDALQPAQATQPTQTAPEIPDPTTRQNQSQNIYR